MLTCCHPVLVLSSQQCLVHHPLTLLSNGRILEKTIKLDKCRNPKATVTIRAWFTPKLEDEDGNEIFLEAPKETEKKTLPPEFTERADGWLKAIKQVAPRAFKKAKRKGGFTWKAMDERAIEHFLPAYLAPMQGPLDLTNPREVVRMVSSITFEADDEMLKVSSACRYSSDYEHLTIVCW